MMVPALAVLLVKTELHDSLDLSCVEKVFCGGAPVHKEVEEALNKKLGGNIYMVQSKK